MPKRRALGLAAVAALTASARCRPKSDCPLEVRDGRHDRLVARKMLRRVPDAR